MITKRGINYIPHDGKDSPFKNMLSTPVEIVVRGGYITQQRAERIRWKYDPLNETSGDVIGYRPIKRATLPLHDQWHDGQKKRV